ncbi:monofunctional biosynthetic peptidoglycan transglycosylase [Cognatilysobacter bugurensis]|uniref:Biosynthetic peptidoglycan transglycosylase n=1 Tax=Cognatilysobacter bugurensis TaxID=543356 RepID=A0A918SYC9_9GAMM|nr:monofunctional biosynthetic peptidoglycan transglycosylase [Lysobacter bugurensis]GHA77810.1 monofunctional biosynthetic peptidoglycan transglycosylase [Lysobacter bugurensis]
MTAANAKPRRRVRWRRWLLGVPLFLVLLTVVQVLALRFIDPPFSSFMVIRVLDAWRAGDLGFRVAYDWRDLDDMAAHVPVALVAAEDQRFAEHFGFDLDAIEKARKANARGRKVRGASTITQQTAKNLFLWSGRSWVRKGIEAWYTVLIEALWPKKRILEVYTNVAEFGDGVYGAQAAGQTYFDRDASRLSASQAARLAAVLPSPKRYSAARPGPYVKRRTRAIQRQMRQIGGASYLRTLD